MTITHLIYSFTTGGAETMLVDIANEQAKDNDVNIVIINRKYNTRLINKIDKSVGVYFIERKEGSKNPLPLLKLNILLLRLNSNTIHCHNFNLSPLLLPLFKKKSVLTIHDVTLETNYYNSYKKLFAISKIVQSDILNRSAMNATLVYNGICCDSVQQKEKYYKSNSFKMVIVSRLVHEKKGQHLAIEALNIIKRKGISNINLDFIGSGSSEQFLKELSENYELSNQINFLGYRDRDYIYNHLNSYDLLIQPSLYEGFGLTVTEGMAARIPVLVSNVDGPMEIIDHGKYGYYFKSGIAEDLANKIEDIYKLSNEAIDMMTSKAYTRAVNSFDITKTANEYLKLYIEKKCNE